MSDQNEDIIIEVKLPLRDYKVMREMIEERQAMHGLRKWISSRLIWAAAGMITIVGGIEALRRLAEYSK